jgi:transcriptional regulator with XRE-family HTH domain
MNRGTEAKLTRIAMGLRQIDLSLKTGISTSLISLYEAGLKTPPPERAKTLNQVLEKSVYDENMSGA